MYLQYAIVPSSNQNEAFRIIFIMDGSWSMDNQYQKMVEVYKKLFSGMNNVEAFQFSSKISSLEPFLGGGTDIQIAMENLTQILERGVPQTNVCAVFVSDGCGSENSENLRARFRELHKKYQIIFLSVAVGKGFPTALSNKLREIIHNASSTLPAIIPVDDNSQFESAFIKVRGYANQQKKISITSKVLRFPWEEPTNQVYPLEIVAVNKNEKLLQNSSGVGSYVPNLSISLTSKFIQSSLQQLIQLTISQDPKCLEHINSMIKYIYSVRKDMEEKRTIHKIALYVDLGKAILFLEDIKSGKLDLIKIGDQKLKEIMLQYTPDKTQTIDSKDSSTSAELFKQAQNKGFILQDLQTIFTIENKNILLQLNKIEDRFQEFLKFCFGNKQLIKSIENNNDLIYQMIDSQLLFKLDQAI